MSAPAVMQLCLTLDTGGLERVVVCLANTLASRHGLDSHIVTVGKTSGELISAGIDKRVTWTELSGPTRFAFKTAWNSPRTFVRRTSASFTRTGLSRWCTR
jgi:hypothetical protein